MGLRGFGSDWGDRFGRDYLSRFVNTLRVINGTTDLCRMSAVKFAADVSLAMTAASSSTTWSQTILDRSSNISPNLITSSCRPKASEEWRTNNFLSTRNNLYNIKRRSCNSNFCRLNNASSKRPMRRSVGRLKKKKVNKIGARIKILKSLVPGGAAMDTPRLLEEALDYICALQVQVQSMNTLVKFMGNAESK